MTHLPTNRGESLICSATVCAPERHEQLLHRYPAWIRRQKNWISKLPDIQWEHSDMERATANKGRHWHWHKLRKWKGAVQILRWSRETKINNVKLKNGIKKGFVITALTLPLPAEKRKAYLAAPSAARWAKMIIANSESHVDASWGVFLHIYLSDGNWLLCW